MFKANSDNCKPNRDELNRVERDKSPVHSPDRSSDFSDLDQFAQWLDRQLNMLERKYEEFETNASRLSSFGR